MKTQKTMLLTLFMACFSFVLPAQTKGGKPVQQVTSGSLKGKKYKVTFNNEGEKDMYIAVAYYDNDPNTMGGHCFYSKGWFKVKKGKSIWMNVSGRRFFYHAHLVNDADVSIGSEKEFYVHPIKKFNIKRASGKRKGGKYQKYKRFKFDKIPESNVVTLK